MEWQPGKSVLWRYPFQGKLAGRINGYAASGGFAVKNAV